MTREYIVRPYHLFFHNIEIKAKSKQEAIEIVDEMLGNNDPALKELYYFGTKPGNEWEILLKKDVDKINIESKESNNE